MDPEDHIFCDGLFTPGGNLKYILVGISCQIESL